jgi:phosphoribosylaminoimidazolecarboxamide formyltransferase/IMP cyclohydrolase
MIRNALISVSNKTNLKPLIKYLYSIGTTIYGTGSTYNHINELSSKTELQYLNKVEDLTQHPEFLDGRVKTLHPKVHGGILADQNNDQHMYELKSLDIPPIDLVVCNLYPFEETISKTHTDMDAIENIDIGGPTMIRAAAKNYNSTYVLTSPEQYEEFIETLMKIEDTRELLLYRKRLAGIAFKNITYYDKVISDYFNNSLKTIISKEYKLEKELKYGLNPQQKFAGLYTSESNKILPFKILSGNPGYINILDAIYSWQLVKETSGAINQVVVASFKHTSPAGVGTDFLPLSLEEKKAALLPEDIVLTAQSTAFIRGRYTDPKSSFGDFLAFSHSVDMETARLIQKEVSDGIIAPDYEEGVIEILSKKKSNKYIILKANNDFVSRNEEIREMHGVTLVQSKNNSVIRPEQFLSDMAKTENKMITRENQINLALGMMTLKYTQSNSICVTYRGQTIGVAAGQQSRIDCVLLACKKAKLWYERHNRLVLDELDRMSSKMKRVDKINNIIRYVEENESKIKYIPGAYCLASDAFFPFRDNIDLAEKYNVRYIVQPGGSLADKLVIDACNEYKMVMFTTEGERFFLH